MVALLAVFAGLCIIFGAHGLAERVLRTVAGLIVVLTLLPGLLTRCDAPEVSVRKVVSTGTGILEVAALILTLMGLVAWRTRTYRARRRDEQLRRSNSPRDRVLPAPPAEVAKDTEDES